MIEKFKKIPTDMCGNMSPVHLKINEIIEVINAITIDVDGTKCVDGSKKPDICELAYLQKENSNLKDEVELLQKKYKIARDCLHRIAHWGPWKDDREEEAAKTLKELDND